MDIRFELLPPAMRRARPTDESTLGFGSIFTDHMFLLEYDADRGWHSGRVAPYGPVSLDPAAMVFHYGQEIFEGLKAYRGADDAVRLFRPEANFDRFRRSASRVCFPELPVEDGLAATEALLSVDHAWIPSFHGASLYIRPAMIATEVGLGVRPAKKALFFIIAGPVGNYYARGLEPVRILVEETYTRASKGGTGEAKTGANYVASLLAAEEAKKQGCDQVLWLDGAERRYVEEVGTMNIFFLFRDELVTPPLGGSILPGITRDSALAIARDWGMKVSERPIEISEVIDGAAKGTLVEVFGTGTAAVISPVGALKYGGRDVVVNGGRMGAFSQRLYDEITGIQYGEREDRRGWVKVVETATP
jgi:branched-chain amino acid aminotransferase